MADEARLHEILDIVEQARREGDKDTEARAVAAYRAEIGQQKQEEPQQPNTWGQAVKNVAEGLGMAGTGIVGNVVGNVAGLGALGYDITANALLHPFSGSQPGQYADPAAVRDRVASFLTYQPSRQDTMTQKVLGAPGRVIGGAGEFLRSGADKIDPSGTLGHVAAAIPQAAADYAGIRGARIATPPKVAPSAPVSEVPTTPQLRQAASSAYEAADQAGVVIKPESTRRVITMMKSVAKTENLGKLPPKLKEAADILTERLEKNEPLSLMDADKVRQIINEAKKSTDPADVRLSKVIQEKYDNYLDSLDAADVATGNAAEGLKLLKEARSTFQRRRKSELLDEIERRADITGDVNYTQAGQDLALRREYAKLAKNERQMKMFTPEEQAAIRQVAKGGTKANILRNLGKMDPSRGGAAQTMNAIVGGGIGGALGAVVGGPAGAGAGAITGNALLGGAAYLANKRALGITRQNIAQARETLVGRGLTETAPPARAGQRTGTSQARGGRPLTEAEIAALAAQQRGARR